jgi:hypothetical protein
MKKHLSYITIYLSILTLTPAYAETVDELKQQLEAQKQINELLKQRIRILEAETKEQQGIATKAAAPSLTADTKTKPEVQAGDPEEDRALERALVRQGLSILPSGRWELTPGIVWAHTGSDATRSRSNDYIATLDARVGLPWNTMLGIGVPYYIEADREIGENNGFGDLSLRVWKQFLAQSDKYPSLVGSLLYNAPTGEDAAGPIPLGSDFHSLRFNLNTSKSIDPLVLYGDLFYSYTFSEDFDDIKIQPSDSIGIRGGASLAITPDITGNLGLRLSFLDELERDGEKVQGTDQTIGFLEVGMGYLLNRRSFLSFSADIGITDDSPDLILGISVPTRF